MGEQAGAGEKVCKGDVGVATLGESWLGTLGRPGKCDGMLEGGLRSRHDSKRSRRLVTACSWVMVEGSGASLRAPAMA